MRKKVSIFLTAAFCCLAFLPLNAGSRPYITQSDNVLHTAGGDMDAFRERLCENAAVKSIVSRFTYTRCVSIFACDLVEEGDFTFNRESGISLEFDSGDYIRIKGENFEMKSGGSISKSKSNPVAKEIKRIMDACLSGDVNALLGGFNAALVEEESSYRLSLTPKSRRGSAFFRSLELQFNRRDMTLGSLKMTENNGDSSTYSFTGQKITR